MSIQVRQATLNDFDKIRKLLEELLGEPINERRDVFIDAFGFKNYVPLVAELNGDIVGFLDIWHFPDPGHGAALGFILNFIVTKDHRKKGIGSRLMEEGIKIARERDFHEFHVWTEFQNEGAIKVYKKHGFINESLILEKGME